MEYRIVKGRTVDQLAERVNLEISGYWKPIGGVLLIEPKTEDDRRTFCQAMTKSV